MKRPDRRLEVETKGFRLILGEKTYVMGVLNVTPDSFSDGGRFFNKEKAVRRALEIVSEGADILDIGGESTRPGAAEVSAEEEIKRVIPVIKEIAQKIDIPISVDTRKSEVAEEAIRAGAAIVNDVSGLKFDGRMAKVAAKYKVALIIMHMKGDPSNMQVNPSYRDLIGEITASLQRSIDSARKAGLSQKMVIVDPGLGFGKTLEHNLKILNRLEEFKVLGRPICIGTSRKSFIGRVLDIKDSDERLAGTLASSAIAIANGANIIRVHDVKEALQASRIADSILKEKAI